MSKPPMDVTIMAEDTFELTKVMLAALEDAGHGHPQYLVAEAATRAAGSVIVKCSMPGCKAASLRIAANLLNEMAERQTEAGSIPS